MIYKEHGLTRESAVYSALKKAGIEMTSHVAPFEITTDVIYIVDTTRHDNEIRADDRRKFAEWFKKSNFYLSFSDTIDDAIAEYEKEQKNE